MSDEEYIMRIETIKKFRDNYYKYFCLNRIKNFIIGSLNNTGRFINFFGIHKFLNLNLIKRALKRFKKY